MHAKEVVELHNFANADGSSWQRMVSRLELYGKAGRNCGRAARLQRHRDAQHNVSCSVCHSFTVLSEQGFGAFPNKQPATARRDRGGPVFGSVATLPMLATFLFLRY